MELKSGMRSADEVMLVEKVTTSDDLQLKQQLSKRFYKKMGPVIVIEGTFQNSSELGKVIESASALQRSGYDPSSLVGEKISLYDAKERFTVLMSRLPMKSKSAIQEYLGLDREYEEVSIQMAKNGLLSVFVKDDDWIKADIIELDGVAIPNRVDESSLISYFGEADYVEGVRIQGVIGVLEMEDNRIKLSILSGVEGKRLVANKTVSVKKLNKIINLVGELNDEEKTIVKGMLNGKKYSN